MPEPNSTSNEKVEKPSERKKPPIRETASSSQSAGKNSSAKQRASSGTEQSDNKPPSQKLAGISFVLLIVLIVVATHFYIKDGTPLVRLPAGPPVSSAQQANPAKQAAPSAEPAFVLLGEYGDEVYTYNKGIKKVYAYNWKQKTEREVCKLVEFDAFHWHQNGKLLVVSNRHNTQGGIYLLDLNPQETCSPQQPPSDDQAQKEVKPEPVLITDREDAPYFPRNLSIESDLPLVWGTTGCRFAFVARDIHDKTQSLFIYNLQDKQLIYTPARHFERITDLVWIEKDEKLAFIGINDGGENRYRVNSSGGDFLTWDAQP